MYLGLVEPPLIDEPKQLGQVGKQGKSQVYVTEEEGERGWERSHRMGFQVHRSGLDIGSAPPGFVILPGNPHSLRNRLPCL